MRFVLLVVRVELLPDRDHASVERMRLLPRHFDHDRLLHLVRDDRADQDLAAAVFFRLALGCRFRHYFFSVFGAASSCSRRIVWTRAISRRSPRIFFKLSVCPIFIWNFSLKSWSAKSRSWCLSSTSVKLRIFSAFIKSVPGSALSKNFLPGKLFLNLKHVAFHKRRPQRKLVRRQSHGLFCICDRNAFHLKQNLSRPHHRHPVVRSPFAFTHTGFGGLLRDRLIRKQTDPDLAAALHKTRHRHPARFDLPVGDPSRFQHFQPKLTESQRAPPPGLPRHSPALLLAVLNFLRHQHRSLSW